MTATAPLPQLADAPFITDGGIETDLMARGFSVPEFAAFVLLDDPAGREGLLAYYRDYVSLARERGVGLLLDTPTWRASPDWGARLGYSAAELDDVNRRAVALVASLRGQAPAIVVSGCVGPRFDGEVPPRRMTADDAERYHAPQVGALAAGGADLVTALTLDHVAEAVGIVRAAITVSIPVAISFTVTGDGRLPDGTALLEAVAAVDAETDGAPAYFMINCAHPSYIAGVLRSGGPAIERLRGFRANASADDDGAEPEDGDPVIFAEELRALGAARPTLTLLGGCCGTDRRHLSALCDALRLDPIATNPGE